jgi:glycosyltransferase involved in cell wall biosynthesis
MRIGIDVNCWSNRRGFGRFVRELIPAMVKQSDGGDEYVLFADRQTAAGANFPNGCKVIVAETSAAATEAASSDGRRSIGDMWAMRKLVKRETLDVMFFPAVYSYFPIANGVPCAVTFHDVIAETLPEKIFKTRRSRFLWNLKSKLALRRARRVVTVSEASKRGLMKHFRLPEQTMRVIGEAPSETFGPVTKRDDAALTRHGITPGERFLLYVGGISPHKNLSTLIDAYGAVKARRADLEDVRLVLVGDYAGDAFTTCYRELCEQVARHGLVGHVHFPGFVPDEDLRHLYGACQAFVFPSYLEGFGLPAVEAMACGAAVVASDQGSLPEVIGGAGHLFNPYEMSSVADAIERVLGDASYRDELRRRSLERAKTFSWERSAREALAVLREMKT